MYIPVLYFWYFFHKSRQCFPVRGCP